MDGAWNQSEGQALANGLTTWLPKQLDLDSKMCMNMKTEIYTRESHGLQEHVSAVLHDSLQYASHYSMHAS